ncbi:sulfatase family protein [Labilibacter marinus]|uniref:sulfatase family protein n=1 Tax=Labilibacter marinus TaxID=1477105 RepID=UPI000835778B|nr:sulfatase [Labilibacter marinus]
MKKAFQLFLVFTLVILCYSCHTEKAKLSPNILWITSEDNSALLGCYGDEYARTPNLDKLASEGFLYTHAYANAPVCAPARNTIASGILASAGGHSNMRSFYKRGTGVRFHAEVLRELGYYCTNTYKTDYNTNVATEIWDQCNKMAHYKNAPEGKPWFAIFNLNISHESKIHTQLPADELSLDPKKAPIAPYHPRTKDMEHDWAQYYQRVSEMDAQVGDILAQLEASGQADNTIVFYYGDHGGVLGRSKRFVYETGTHVPFIVRIPEKYKSLWPAEKVNSKVDRIITFADLYPTLLNILGEDIPESLQGQAFLGDDLSENPKYAYMFRDRMDEWYDMSRAVRSKQYRYIHNYMPHRIYGLRLEFMFRAKSLQSWEQAYKNGECNSVQSRFWETKPTEELYDTENDPWEINNLAENPEYADVLKEMRKANRNWLIKIKDTGFLSEDERLVQAKGDALYDYFQSGKVDIESIIDAADLASYGKVVNKTRMVEFLQSGDAAVRYWGATGLLILGEHAKSEVSALKAAVNDSSVSVSIVAAEALYQLGEKEAAYKGFTRAIRTDREFAQTLAMNSIYLLHDDSQVMKDEVLNAYKRMEVKKRSKYNYRCVMNLAKQWGIEVK